MAIYKAKLSPQGAVVMHVSNRHLELASVIVGIADANDQQYVAIAPCVLLSSTGSVGLADRVLKIFDSDVNVQALHAAAPHTAVNG